MDFWLMIPNAVFTVSAKSETKLADNNAINIGRYRAKLIDFGRFPTAD